MKTKALIYSRVSSKKQNTTSQCNDLKTLNYEIVKEFTEQVSGKQKDRPVLNECINFAKENNISNILVWELSRLGRSSVDVLNTIEKIKEANINLIIKQFEIETMINGKPNPMAQLFLTMLAAISELELTSIKDRLDRGYKDYTERGGKVGRKVGYRISNNDLLKKYANVVKLLKKKKPIREVATLTQTSPKTVQTVKKAMTNLSKL